MRRRSMRCVKYAFDVTLVVLGVFASKAGTKRTRWSSIFGIYLSISIVVTCSVEWSESISFCFSLKLWCAVSLSLGSVVLRISDLLSFVCVCVMMCFRGRITYVYIMVEHVLSLWLVRFGVVSFICCHVRLFSSIFSGEILSIFLSVLFDTCECLPCSGVHWSNQPLCVVCRPLYAGVVFIYLNAWRRM